MTALLAKLSMAVWLSLVALWFGRQAWRPRHVTLHLMPLAVRRIGLIGVAGGLLEVVTLWMGGFWSW